jgi:uncharacterized protein (TIGR00661 family)
MTQAIAMNEMLRRHGHEVKAVLVGSNQTRSLPAFFEQAFAVPVRQIASPGFSLKKGRAISLGRTAGNLARHVPEFRRSLATLDETIKAVEPDLIVNFLEPLMGVYNLLHPHSIPVLAVGHQFMLGHPEFITVPGYQMQQFGMKQYVRLTGARSSRLALSFYPAKDLPERQLFVAPPILRRQLFELQPDFSGGYFQIYLLNHGYAEKINEWHRRHRDIPIHCFYDKAGAPPEEHVDANLTFHKIHGEKFLQMMAKCRALATTAGFESVSEAAYLGKPLLMVPVENHFEQYLNACDAEKSGIGIRDTTFRLSRLLDPPNPETVAKFRSWVNEAETRVIRAIEITAATGRKRLDAPAQPEKHQGAPHFAA